MATAGDQAQGKDAAAPPKANPVPKTITTVGRRGPDVIKAAIAATSRAAQVRAASIAAAKKIADERAKAQQNHGS
jgi:hypothetical protein